jgi:hypothetical protein
MEVGVAQHRPGREAGGAATQPVGPLHQRVDEVPAGLAEGGQLPGHRVVAVGVGERGRQPGEELAPARPERLPADQPGELRCGRQPVDPRQGGPKPARTFRNRDGPPAS